MIWLISIGLLCFGLFWLAYRGKCRFICLSLATILIIELTAAIAYRFKDGYLIYHKRPNPNTALFETDPYSICRLKANVDTIINKQHVYHNEFGWRDTVYQPKPYQIACIGGSTTYGVGVSNKDTWPNMLEHLLADSIQVINLGVPGHTTNEHFSTLIYDAAIIRPKLIIFHVGLNDMRLAYTSDLDAKYLTHHYPALYRSVGLDFRNQLPPVASLRLLADLAIKAGLTEPTPNINLEKTSDPKKNINQLKAIYRLKLKQLIALARVYTDHIVFVPQVLIPEAFYHSNYQWWAPHLPDSEVVSLMHEFNVITREVAETHRCLYVDNISNIPFSLEHYTDPSHLNQQGINWFTDSLAAYLKGQYIKLKGEN